MTSSARVVSVRPLAQADLDDALGGTSGRRLRGRRGRPARGIELRRALGGVGYFGPLTVRPDLWDQGPGRHLMDSIMDRFERWNIRHHGLFTFAHRPKHLELYLRFGFWPRFLTAVMGKPVAGPGGPPPTYATVAAGQRPEYLASCWALTDSVYAGLDLGGEIQSVHTQGIGDTVLLEGDVGLDGLAVCHLDSGSEAGAGVCYVKFGPSPAATPAGRFERLLDACEQLAADRGHERVDAGMNLACTDAYGRMIDRGYRTGCRRDASARWVRN